MRAKPKITDVARASGVSIATVSHVINGTRSVSAESTARVNAAIAQLGYTPNAGARSLKTGKYNLIGCVVPNISDRFFALIMEEIEDTISPQGYNLLLFNTRDIPERETEALKFLSSGVTDGIICASTFETYQEFAQNLSRDFPIVLIDRLPKGFIGDSVRVSCAAAVKEAIRDMIAGGHRRIGCISSIKRLSSTEERVNAYLSALEEANIPIDPTLIKNGDSRSRSGYECMRELVEQKVDAVFITNSLMASGAFKLLDTLHMTIGTDIQVAAMRDFEWHRFQQENVRTVEQPAQEMAHYAAQQLLERINSPSSVPREVILPATYHAESEKTMAYDF